jgi:hypothetical protein
MKEKILALLTGAFPGVRKDGLNHIAGVLAFQVDTEEKAKEVVGKLTADQVNTFITDWRKEADAEISRANKTHEENLRKKHDFAEKKTDKTDVTPPLVTTESGTVDAAAIQRLITDTIAAATKPLLEQINVFKAGETAKTRLQTLNDKLKDCKDDVFKTKVLKDFARMKFETDDEFTEYLNDTEADVKTANQKVADLSLNTSRPWMNNTPLTGGEATEAEIKEVMERLPI